MASKPAMARPTGVVNLGQGNESHSEMLQFEVWRADP